MPATAWRLVVGVDGSDDAHRAVEWAAELVDAVDGDLVLVHAVGLLAHLEPGAPPVSANDHRGELARRLEQQWAAPARRLGVPYRALMIDGEPVTVLAEAAVREGADAIVVGSRGAGLAQTLLGSTSMHLTMKSPLPVTVVPSAARAPSREAG